MSIISLQLSYGSEISPPVVVTYIMSGDDIKANKKNIY